MVEEYPLKCIGKKKNLVGAMHGEGYALGCRCRECVTKELERLNNRPSGISYKKLKEESRRPKKWKVHLTSIDKTIYI